MLPTSDPQFLPLSHPAGGQAYGHMAVVQVQAAVEGEVARTQPLGLESGDRQCSSGSREALPQDLSELLYSEPIGLQVRQSISVKTILRTEALAKGLLY